MISIIVQSLLNETNMNDSKFSNLRDRIISFDDKETLKFIQIVFKR